LSKYIYAKVANKKKKKNHSSITNLAFNLSMGKMLQEQIFWYLFPHSTPHKDVKLKSMTFFESFPPLKKKSQ